MFCDEASGQVFLRSRTYDGGPVAVTAAPPDRRTFTGVVIDMEILKSWITCMMLIKGKIRYLTMPGKWTEVDIAALDF